MVNAFNSRFEILKLNKTENKFNFDIISFYDIKDIYNKVMNIFIKFNSKNSRYNFS